MMRKYLLELAGKLTRPIQETIARDEIGHEPALCQEISLAHIVECRAAMTVCGTLGEKQGFNNPEFSGAAGEDFDDIAELL
jgi:hypothetical protein